MSKEKESSVIYVGHLPNGFYEKALMKYFGQFGKVLKVRVARNVQTGRSKGYGFVKFRHSSVAKIAASAMNNYLMFNKIIKSHVVEQKDYKRNMFNGVRLIKKQYLNPSKYRNSRMTRNLKRSVAKDIKKANERKLKRQMHQTEKLKNRLADKNIEFSYESIFKFI